MPIRTGLIVGLLTLAGCSGGGVSSFTVAVHAPTGPAPGAGICKPNQPCTLMGTIELQRRTGMNSWASLSNGQACAPLLVSNSVYRRARHWSGKRVTVSGTAFTRLPDPRDAISTVQYRDRWLPSSICGESDLVLYVENVTQASQN